MQYTAKNVLILRNLLSLLSGGSINFDDINYDKSRYWPVTSYSQSKLANILFSKELAKRLEGKHA